MSEETAERILRALGETKGELVALQAQTAALVHQVATQNGRVGKLEDWRVDVLLADARAAGNIEGRTGLRKTQVAVLTAAVTVGSSVVGTVIGILARVA